MSTSSKIVSERIVAAIRKFAECYESDFAATVDPERKECVVTLKKTAVPIEVRFRETEPGSGAWRWTLVQRDTPQAGDVWNDVSGDYMSRRIERIRLEKGEYARAGSIAELIERHRSDGALVRSLTGLAPLFRTLTTILVRHEGRHAATTLH